MTNPIKIFISYAHLDEDLRLELNTHLSNLQRQGGIASWHDRQIIPGQDWSDQIDKALNEAQIILLLISARFISSDYCYEREMLRAVERHDAGEAVVIPIILSYCDWEGTPFSKLQALPKNAEPIISKKWANHDEAWTDVIRGIRKAIEHLTKSHSLKNQTKKQLPLSLRRDRRIDAAMPSQAVVGQRVDLLVQVRFPDSRLLGLEEWPLKRKPTSIEQASETTSLEFPIDSISGKAGNAQLKVRIITPDFEIEGASEKLLEVPPDTFSKIVSFLLSAKRAGYGRINVEIYDLGQVYLGVAPIEIEIGGEIALVPISPAYYVANFHFVVSSQSAPIAIHPPTCRISSGKPISELPQNKLAQLEENPSVLPVVVSVVALLVSSLLLWRLWFISSTELIALNPPSPTPYPSLKGSIVTLPTPGSIATVPTPRHSATKRPTIEHFPETQLFQPFLEEIARVHTFASSYQTYLSSITSFRTVNYALTVNGDFVLAGQWPDKLKHENQSIALKLGSYWIAFGMIIVLGLVVRANDQFTLWATKLEFKWKRRDGREFLYRLARDDPISA